MNKRQIFTTQLHTVRRVAPQHNDRTDQMVLTTVYVTSLQPIYITLSGNSVLQVQPPDQRGLVAIRSGQNFLEPENLRHAYISRNREGRSHGYY